MAIAQLAPPAATCAAGCPNGSATSALMRPEPLQLAGKTRLHRSAVLVAHGPAALRELGVVCLEEVNGGFDERQVLGAPPRVAYARWPRHGSYRLARLADRYGAEMTMPHLCEMLSADCKLRDGRRSNVFDRCGAFFPDMGGARPPDEPARATKPRLKVVR